jgi:hypothetical protein
MTHESTQADRDAAADFVGNAWHLFFPGDFQKALDTAKEIRDGYCDVWAIVQAFTAHAQAARDEGYAKAIEDAAALLEREAYRPHILFAKRTAYYIRKLGSL